MHQMRRTWKHASGRPGLSRCLLAFVSIQITADGGEPSAPLNLFTVPRPQLRSVAQFVSVGANSVRGSSEEFVLRTGKTESTLDSQIQTHQSMNGTALVRQIPTRTSGNSFQRTLDALLPPKAALFNRNPNARRDPLRILEE
jgi:hypothetical protein